MKYERFIDKVRMTTIKKQYSQNIKALVIQRIYPRIIAMANRGRSRIIYQPAEEVIAPNYSWIQRNWEDIKAYLEAEGFECYYWEETGEYHIVW